MPKTSAAARPLADLSNLPISRAPCFTGRDGFLSDLARSFQGGSHMQVIHGLGGVGKTQVALEFAGRHRAQYAIAWWVRSETQSSMVEAMTKLAARLGRVVPQDASTEMICELVKNVLASRSDWLMVFDGAATVEDVQPYLPSGNGHVLITTRNTDVARLGKSQPLGVLERDDSVSFLRQRTESADGPANLDRLAHALGDLPLALEQAAAVIIGNHLSCESYLRRYETEWADLLVAGPPPEHYPHTVAMTWGLAFAAVETASLPAAGLLNFVAYLCPDHISNKMLRDGSAYLPDAVALLARNPLTLEKAMAALGNFSLVQPAADGVVIHRLVATITRDRLEIDEQRTWCRAAIYFLSKVFLFDSADVQSWKRCGELLPHLLEATAHADRLDTAHDETAELLNDAGRYLLKRAQFTEARQLLNRAMAISARRYGDSHPKLSAIANNLGRVYERMGDDAVAVRYFELALTIDQSAYGAEHPHVAEVINNYGICIQKQGDRQQARDKFAYAAQLYEMHYGSEHPKLANILNNLGYAMQSIGEIDEAEPYLLRALSIAENSVGPEHPTTASILYNLATILNRRQQPAAALVYLERALAIDQAILGPDHPNTRRDTAALQKWHGRPARDVGLMV